MPRLQDSPHPLVFPLPASARPEPDARASDASRLVSRVDVRSLEGMQKEALVSPLAPAGAPWRMVSDEGPYLNGTDLAPFPLGFFAAGLACSFMSELLRHARERGVSVGRLDVQQETRYTMMGSVLRGDMTGGALPVDVLVRLESAAPANRVQEVITLAEASSPGHAVMRDVLANTFSLALNGQAVPITGVCPSARLDERDPADRFASLAADAAATFPPDIITKRVAAQRVVGVAGGAASSLQAEQKRTLHVRADGRLRADGLVETDIRLFQPLGSTFRFLCDPSADPDGRTPSAIAFLSAGIAFCYMTQLGRYAHIVKQRIREMRVVQYNVFRRDPTGATPATAAPVDTHVFFQADEPEDAALRTVRMGEQTCFLHAAMRGSFPTRVRLELNGHEVPLVAGANATAPTGLRRDLSRSVSE